MPARRNDQFDRPDCRNDTDFGSFVAVDALRANIISSSRMGCIGGTPPRCSRIHDREIELASSTHSCIVSL